MNHNLHAENNGLTFRERQRGTGRTTRIIQRLIEHVYATQINKPVGERNGIFIIGSASQWEAIVRLAQAIQGYQRADEKKRILYFEHATIHCTDRDNCEQFLRGLSWPMALDHTMWEMRAVTPEILYRWQDRIINFN